MLKLTGPAGALLFAVKLILTTMIIGPPVEVLPGSRVKLSAVNETWPRLLLTSLEHVTINGVPVVPALIPLRFLKFTVTTVLFPPGATPPKSIALIGLVSKAS